ncbi:MAG: outer membrane lipoprotein carrier protein LolA [Bacteroidia bacterium]|nr:outer membrane lipoprotein carrier protein LolA [Bacteroidia bacterium]
MYLSFPSLIRLGWVLLLTGSMLSAAAQDTKATNVLNASKSKLESLGDFAATVKYTVDNPASAQKAPSKTGKLKYKRGMYVLMLDDQEIYCNKITQWVYLKKDKEVNITAYDPREAVSLESVFTIYKANGKPRYEGAETLHGVACHKVYIALADPKVEYNQARLWINQQTNLLEKITLTDRRQTSTTYEFFEVRTNQGLGDGDFSFNPAKVPGLKVYDER